VVPVLRDLLRQVDGGVWTTDPERPVAVVMTGRTSGVGRPAPVAVATGDYGPGTARWLARCDQLTVEALIDLFSSVAQAPALSDRVAAAIHQLAAALTDPRHDGDPAD
jgi:hypothetical protein